MSAVSRVVTVITAVSIILSVIAFSGGVASGQILTEKSYYSEEFDEYNTTAVDLKHHENLQDQHLTNTGQWVLHAGGNYDGTDGPTYGGPSTQRHTGHIDTDKPWLSVGAYDRYDTSHSVGMKRTLSVPSGMSNPVLVVEHAQYREDSNLGIELAVGDRIKTSQRIDQEHGWILRQAISSAKSDYTRAGRLKRAKQQNWKTTAFQVPSGKDNVTVEYAARQSSDSYQSADWISLEIRNLYWVDASSDTVGSSINGYEAQPPSDSLNGPDPYNLFVVKESTAEGEEVSLRANGQTIKREFTLANISTKPQKVYFEMDATAYSSPVDWKIKQYGEEVASGTISAESNKEVTSELDLNGDTFTLVIEPRSPAGRYDIHSVNVVGLQETTKGDPLSSDSPVSLDADKGYDRTIGVMVGLLDLTTETLMYIVFVALIIGAMVFSYTKSVRGQEFAQSMLYGAVIMGIVMVGLTPTMNAAGWIFEGTTERAPLADPALEAEPPTYYSTEFQDGTMSGWENPVGSARPVSVGDSFRLSMTEGADAAVVRRNVEISLGDSLSTGFVRLKALAQSTAGYTSNPHQTYLRVRIYVTNGSAPDRLPPTFDSQNKSATNASDDIVVDDQFLRSFNGQTASDETTYTFPLEGNTIYVELIALDNRDDEQAKAALSRISIGATTQSQGEIA